MNHATGPHGGPASSECIAHAIAARLSCTPAGTGDDTPHPLLVNVIPDLMAGLFKITRRQSPRRARAHTDCGLSWFSL